MRNSKLSIFGALIIRISALTKLFSAGRTQIITSNLLMFVMMTLLLSLAGGLAFAADGSPMTPELAAKKEMVRKQAEQRITPEKRKAAAEALKAERMKVHQAQQAVQQSTPVTSDTK